MPILTILSHIETIRACVHPMVTTGFYIGLGRSTPWLSHSLTLIGQSYQATKAPSSWTILGLALAFCYLINLFTFKSLILDTTLGSIILMCALAENLYTATTTTCPTAKTNALISSTFLTLVAIIAQTVTLAPNFSFYLAASLFSLISLKNLHSLGCFLHSLTTPVKLYTSVTPDTPPPHKASHLQHKSDTNMQYQTTGATTKPAQPGAPKSFPLAGAAPKKRGWPPQTTPIRRG